MTRYVMIIMTVSLSMISIPGAAEQWYRGGLHMHSLWSDGDSAPELVAAWYKEHGWHFICFTDHNILLEDEHLKPIAEGANLTEEHVAALREQFGEDWVETVEHVGRLRMRLKTFEELSGHFSDPGAFLLMHGEEITTFGGSPHVLAINTVERIGGEAQDDIIELTGQYISAVYEQGERHDRPVLAALAHPNWSDAVTVEEALAVERLSFFEVFNGHPSVNNWGREDLGYPPTDLFWDIVLSMRLKDDPDYILYGLATDDTHDLHDWGRRRANPGRGWVMVRAAELSPEALISAMQRGDFYSSTGVTLDNIRRDSSGLAFDVVAEPGVTYQTRFVGTRRGFDPESAPYLDEDGEIVPRASRQYSNDIGEVLLETTDTSPVYTFTGDELYVRAIVVSDKAHPNPFREGDTEMAWVQPVILK